MTTYRNRKAVQLENDHVRVTVLVEGGHIAELLHKETGVNPLWTPPWPSIEPSAYSPELHPEYGSSSEARLLAGIMGHNLCLDIFGGPSEEEAAAGLGAHGEASVAPYEILLDNGVLTARASCPQAGLRVQRTISLSAPTAVRVVEEVENVTACDRAVGWTQHVTLGSPFVEPGVTEFRVSAARSKVFDPDFAGRDSYMRAGAEFDWPYVPRYDGEKTDMRTFVNLPVSGAYTAHLLDRRRRNAFFLAWSPRSKVVVGYVWNQADFPWLGIWEENRSRTGPPWNGRTITRGMEFGVSPMPETRRQMIERGRLFGTPTYRWIPAKTTVRAVYGAFITTAGAIPEEPPIEP